MSVNQPGPWWDQPWWILVVVASFFRLLWDLVILPFLTRKKANMHGEDAAMAYQESLSMCAGIIVFVVVASGTIFGAVDAYHVDMDIKNKVHRLASEASGLHTEVNNVLTLADANRNALSALPQEFATKETVRFCVSAVLRKNLFKRKYAMPADCTLPPGWAGKP